MMWNYMQGFWGNGFQWPGMAFGLAILPFLWPLLIVDVILRGITLWLSARRGQKVWFIVLLIINTAGILPLIYLLLHRGKRKR